MQPADFFQTAAAGALMGFLLVFPARAARSALEALTAFAVSVLPALLPFSVCALLITAGKTLPAAGVCLLALPGGSPAGARLFQDAALPPGAARRCAAATGGMSAMFFLGTLAGWLESPAAGRLLLAAHWLSALGAALLAGPRTKAPVTMPALSVPQAVSQAAQAMLTAAACAAMGAVCAGLAGALLPRLGPLPRALAQGAAEVTLGCRALTALRPAPPLLLPLLAALTAFGGGAILLQNAVFWRKNGLALSTLCGLALLRAGLAFFLCLLLAQLPIL